MKNTLPNDVAHSPRGAIRLAGRAARRLAAAALALLLLAAGPADGVAQGVRDEMLDRVQNLISTGRYTEARNTLDRWQRENGDPRSAAGGGDRARALFLQGVLAGDAGEAEDIFVAVVLSYPSSAAAPDALLRLGQGILTAGDAPRALAYLERLRNDYPGAAARETGLLWLARAQLAAGMPGEACTSAREGVAGASAAHLRTLMELEQDRACGAPATAAARPTPPAQTPPARQDPPPPAAAAGSFAVQTGAYRERGSAETIAGQMRDRGFEVRVVLVGDSPLHRVRSGAYATIQEAHEAAARIRAAGFAVLVVNDVPAERR
jgi:hypothetical protein